MRNSDENLIFRFIIFTTLFLPHCNFSTCYGSKHQVYKMVKLSNPTNCLSVFDHFVELALTGLTEWPDLAWKFRRNFLYFKHKIAS